MKYFKTQNLYKASNVTFDPSKVVATSYGWWVFVAVIENKIVFNEHRYSVSTAKHQSKVRDLMEKLGIVPDLIINVKRSIHNDEHLQFLIKDTASETETREKAKAQRVRYNRNVKRLTQLVEQGFRNVDGTPINVHLDAQQFENELQERAAATIKRIGPKVLEDAKELMQLMKGGK